MCKPHNHHMVELKLYVAKIFLQVDQSLISITIDVLEECGRD